MVRYSLIWLSAAALVMVGCENNAQRATGDAQRTRLAADAATIQYPGNSLSDDLSLGAVILTNGDLRLVNFSNQAVNDGVVWVNKEYLYRIANIPPKGIVTLGRSLFFNGQGRDLTTEKAGVNMVQVQIGNRLVDVAGPAMEAK